MLDALILSPLILIEYLKLQRPPGAYSAWSRHRFCNPSLYLRWLHFAITLEKQSNQSQRINIHQGGHNTPNRWWLMAWIYWALLSALFAAITAILAKIGVSGVDSNLATAIRTSVVVVFTWMVALFTFKHDAIHILTPRTWFFLTLSGIATGLSWLCYFRALQLGPASRVAPIDKLSVVFVILFAAMFLGERITGSKLMGGALIAAGAVVLALD